jgi:hypothetical protein
LEEAVKIKNYGRNKMQEITKEFNGDGSKVKCSFPCTTSGCGKIVDEILDKPADGHSDITAVCACDTSYEITIQTDDGDVSGIVTIRDVNNTLKKEQVTLTVIK